VGENLLDHRGVLHTGDDPRRPAEGGTGLDVDARDAFQPFRPGCRVRALDGSLLPAAQHSKSEPGVSDQSGGRDMPIDNNAFNVRNWDQQS